MAFLIVSESALDKVAAPNLPRAPAEYSAQYQEQNNNVLRLFFNRFIGIFDQLNSRFSYIPAFFVYTVSTLPGAALAGVGARAFVSDATVTTFASTVVGGGVNKVPVYSDGVNWKIG
jgi:hypothetical protein